MSNVLVVLIGCGALGLAALAYLRGRSLRESLQDTQRRLYLAQARLNELESTVVKELQTLRVAIRRQSGASLLEPTMKIADVIAVEPRAREVLAQFHLGGCSSCAINEDETIEQAATNYGINIEHLMAALESLGNGEPSPSSSSRPGRLLQLGEF
jgi:hybrid cluster-associated redox disulfide protein